jgi:N-acyl homoserine lactone hydrolase
MEVIPLASGFPGSSDRGFLGWSSCALLRGERPMLFDTLGYNERYVLLERLRSHGVAPSDVATVFLSHFHFDHALNYRLFPGARLYLHEAELEYARSRWQEDLAIPIEALADLLATGRVELLAGESGTVEGVEWFLAPGHTAGLYGLRTVRNGRRLVLASDAVKNLAELRSGKVAIAWDHEAAARSVARVVELADVVLPGHDRAADVRRAEDGTVVEIVPLEASEVLIRAADEANGEVREWRLRV